MDCQFDVDASVMHAHAVNAAAVDQRSFTMVNFDCEGKVSYRIPFKTRGQLAYERDCILMPTYHDGIIRKTWNQLGEVEQWSWNRNPTTRDEERTALRHEDILAGLGHEVPHSRIREANGTPRQWTYNGKGGMVR